MNSETYNKLVKALKEQRKRIKTDKKYGKQLLQELGIWDICKNSTTKMKQKKNLGV